MLSYQDFTEKERRAIVAVIEIERDKLDALITTVNTNSSEIVLRPDEARRVAELVRPYYMFIAHKFEDHPGYEPE
jgi:hypothetical protein